MSTSQALVAEIARGQFVHVAAYPRRVSPNAKEGSRSVEDIVKEAERHAEHSRHVGAPQTPTLRFGVPFWQAMHSAESWARQKRVPYITPRGKTYRRRLRMDQPCALVGVASVPPEFRQGPDWEAFVARTITWLKRKYGERLKSVIEHLDEKNLHLHFFVVPNYDEDFVAVHQGLAATAGMSRHVRPSLRKATFGRAMRLYQDEFHEAVGGPSGLQRISVGAKRVAPEMLDVMKSKNVAANRRAKATKGDEAIAASLEVQALRDKCAALERQVAMLEAIASASNAKLSGPARSAAGMTGAMPAPQGHARSHDVRTYRSQIVQAPMSPLPTTKSAPTPFDDFKRPTSPRPR